MPREDAALRVEGGDDLRQLEPVARPGRRLGMRLERISNERAYVCSRVVFCVRPLGGVSIVFAARRHERTSEDGDRSRTRRLRERRGKDGGDEIKTRGSIKTLVKTLAETLAKTLVKTLVKTTLVKTTLVKTTLVETTLVGGCVRDRLHRLRARQAVHGRDERGVDRRRVFDLGNLVSLRTRTVRSLRSLQFAFELRRRRGERRHDDVADPPARGAPELKTAEARRGFALRAPRFVRVRHVRGFVRHRFVPVRSRVRRADVPVEARGVRAVPARHRQETDALQRIHGRREGLVVVVARVVCFVCFAFRRTKGSVSFHRLM